MDLRNASIIQAHYLSRARMRPETDTVELVLAGFCLAGMFVRACMENLVSQFDLKSDTVLAGDLPSPFP